jgi:hypothetical protein
MANDEGDQLTNFELQETHQDILLGQGKVSLTAVYQLLSIYDIFTQNYLNWESSMDK